MNLKKLFKGIEYTVLQGTAELSVEQIAVDSRKVKEKALFVCIKGAKSDGHRFIRKAIELGAAAVVVENSDEDLSGLEDITVIKVQNSRKALAVLADNWYGHPARDLKMIGITGTKGKTTTACMIKAVLEKAGHKTGMIGTMGVFYGDVTEKTPNTTPDALTLHRVLRSMVDAGCTHAVMEVSSQGFKQHRTEGITFDYGLFLNIDYDHIGEDEHADFEEYLACKKQLFNQSKKMIVNQGNRLWGKLTQEEQERSITFSTSGAADYYISSYAPIHEKNCLGSRFALCGKLSHKTRLNIPGEYNISNALAAIALADQMQIPKPPVFEALESFEAEGRTQLIKGAAKYHRTVLIDYAHNGISMESMLKALKVYGPRQIICVFGMRWDETKMRRYDMGKAAGKFADQIILTEDNTGPETLESINADIIEGIRENQKDCTVIPDRKAAICYALDHSGKQDIVVLIGKGHERYQEINGQKIYFSESDIVEEHLQKKRKAACMALQKQNKNTGCACAGVC